MTRLNRVDPFGDLHAVESRGLFTGNRGCLVDEDGHVVRHHAGSPWITCALRHKNWRSPLAAPRHWTPLFFLDDAVALAAGHRPCGLCRRDDYDAYKTAVMYADGIPAPPKAGDLNRRLAKERLRPGRGLNRADHRRLWTASTDNLPTGTIILGPGQAPHLVLENRLMQFGFPGWTSPAAVPLRHEVTVLTPPTSVAALRHGFVPVLHPSATL